MASQAGDFRSVSGKAETTEPGETTRASSVSGKHDSSSASSITPTPTLRKQPSSTLNPPATTSAGNSPRTSRNTSPTRPSARLNSHDTSPSRLPVASTTSSAPSAAAIQRALSASNVPQLQPGPVTEAVSKLAKSPRAGPTSGEHTPTTPHWPASPRIKSPPSEGTSRRNSAIAQRKIETTPAPSIVVQGSTPSSNPSMLEVQTSTKAALRGASATKPSLETVEENTPPSTIHLAHAPSQSISSLKSSDDDHRNTSDEKEASEKQARIGESESEGNKSDGRGRSAHQAPPSAPRPKTMATKNAFTPLTSVKSRQAESATRNMTVETETVSSIPQSQLTVGDRSGNGRADGGGSLRLKPSNETIRPKKDKKKPSRKAASVHNGTASSKADIFEARVASAVDEANSSDSDETFVYESNPPEVQLRSGRNHSRTPSGTSVASDRRGGRGYGSTLSAHRVSGKRSMKFSTNPYNFLDSPTDLGDGTVRAHHPRHITRVGRSTGSHSSLYDPESPFTQASKLRQDLVGSTRQGSRPTTPRSTNSGRPSGPWSKKPDLSQYDFDGEGADDERTPMVGSVRASRRYPRRYDSDTGRSTDDIFNIREAPFCTRWGSYLFGMLILILVLAATTCFLTMSNKMLYDVQVRRIQNVLASEQELMLDLYVGAVNPNILGITVTDLDVNVFAKSTHLPPDFTTLSLTGSRMPTTKKVSPQSESKSDDPPIVGTPWQDPSGHWGPEIGKPLEGDSQTMLLGRILKFDTELTFDGSPFKRHAHFAVGEMRLAKPGNTTEAGGSERWERILQYPFELILRGVLKYQLPISNRERTAAIAGSVLVHPEDIDPQDSELDTLLAGH